MEVLGRQRDGEGSLWDRVPRKEVVAALNLLLAGLSLSAQPSGPHCESTGSECLTAVSRVSTV